MMLHREVNFEKEICEWLAAHGWLYEEGDCELYDKAHALWPQDLVAWVKETQPKSWEALFNVHGEAAHMKLMERLRQQLDTRGTLDVLRHGFEVLGLRQSIQIAQFRPAHTLNGEILAKYQANRLRIVRQVRYSKHSENSIDLVLFLNGIPVATAELKTDFTQKVEDAVDQYRFDRLPEVKGKGKEPLLSFLSGALVHFAVSQREVRMTTKLEGAETRFLPFNQGTAEGGAGNPPNEHGHLTAYLWERIWDRDSWLEILGRYLVVKKDKKKEAKSIIFPRFHQLDATRKLVAAVLQEGVGKKYLVQHSAGSGKTNSIAWTAHFLADLHDRENRKVFDSVIVVSDRTVIDDQLQDAIGQFERTVGVVAVIKGESGSKSEELRNALAQNKKIIACTIQTFPFVLKEVQELSITQGKKFAVIADEAHSSQTGEAAIKLKAVLSAEEQQELKDGGSVSIEDMLAAQMSGRSKQAEISYIAFTATPKTKTMEIFGRPLDSKRPCSSENPNVPFHSYTMRQAIEEGFILDVLKNYTPYTRAFKLAQEHRDLEQKMVERKGASKKIMRWVQLHPHNVAQKVRIVVEHFREHVEPLLDGEAKAMVVVSSRQEAVRWKQEMDRYIQEHAYAIGTLVAFSGEVHDELLGSVTENSKQLNRELNGRDIRDAFDTDEYRILLVANKFQTGFDQDKLCGMYIDKKLGGIQAVQTLSRLNRARQGKDTTYVLDFVNDVRQILDAFKTYYTTAKLEEASDPNQVLNLRAKLDAAGFYDDQDVEKLVAATMKTDAKHSDLGRILEPVADRVVKRHREAQVRLKAAEDVSQEEAAQEIRDEIASLELFKADVSTFQNLYTFHSQIVDFGSTAIEKRYIFFKYLLPLLEFGRERESIDLTKIRLTHYKLRSDGKRDLTLHVGDASPLKAILAAGSGMVQEKEKALLAEILERVNQLFDGELTDDDKVGYINTIKTKLTESDILVDQAASNSKEQFANSVDLTKGIEAAIISALEAHTSMSKQALKEELTRLRIKDILLGPAKLYETLKGKAAHRNNV